MVEVDIEISNKDWDYAVRAVAEFHSDVIRLICAAWQDVLPNGEPPLLSRHHLEAEGVGA